MFTFGFAGGEHGFDPLGLLLIALLLDAYLGDARMPFRLFRHPVEIIGSLIDSRSTAPFVVRWWSSLSRDWQGLSAGVGRG